MLKNPILIAINDYRRTQIIKKIPELALCSHEFFLSIDKYLNHLPEKYFDKKIYCDMFAWLNTRYSMNSIKLKEYFEVESNNLSKAFECLTQINNTQLHDDFINGIDDIDILRNIDSNIHPTYLRTVESIFTQLIKPIAVFSRIDRNKPLEGLDLYNSIEEIKLTSLAYIVKTYNHTLRNAIAHGGITFRNSEIEYTDKKGNSITLFYRDIIRLFDDLIDVCNSLSLSMKVFLLLYKNEGIKLPHSFLMEELFEETKRKGIKVEGCVETIIPQGNQLILYTRPNTTDDRKILFLSFHIAMLAEYLSPGYVRYFISLKSDKCMSGWIAFSGNELEKIRKSKSEEYLDYKYAIESPGLFFIPKYRLPRIFYKLDSLIESFKYQYEIQTDIFKQTLLKATILVKNANMHKNYWGMILSGEIVIDVKNNEISEYIRKYSKKLIHSALKKARNGKSFFSIERYLPIGYARISIYSREYRKRRLSGYGLGEDLVCTIQIKRISRIQSPDIWGAQIEQVGKYRIAWNKNWLTPAST